MDSWEKMMENLSLIQKYFLCAVGENGKLSSLRTEELTALIAAGLADLRFANVITLDDGKVAVVAEIPSRLAHLMPLYTSINQSSPVKVKKVLNDYLISVRGKKLGELIESVGESLAVAGVVTVETNGLMGSKKVYRPDQQEINAIIGPLRSELTESARTTEYGAVLVALLDRSKKMKEYFSDFERKQFHEKVEQITARPEGRMVKEMIRHVNMMFTGNMIAGMAAGLN